MIAGDYIMTHELIAALIDPGEITVEASYNIGKIRCTHVMYYDNGIIHDEGIDGEVSEYTLEEAYCLYNNLTWRIWNITDRTQMQEG